MVIEELSVSDAPANAVSRPPVFDIVIEANSHDREYWRDLWRYRELFYFLTWRDVLVRYKQTMIGIAWSVLRPLLTMIVFTFVFGRIAKLPSGGIPYPLLVYAGMLPWQFFSSALTEASNSLIGNANLLTKVYFPRLIIPTSAVMTTFVDFLISFVILIGLMAWYHVMPPLRVLLLPLFLLQAFLAAFGAGLIFCALNVKYRDFRYVVPFVVQIGLYASPVGFSSAVIPEQWRLVYALNPMVGVIDGFRWCLLGGAEQLYVPGFLASNLVIAGLLAYGFRTFRRMERTFADIV
jgi:homopolymeric O-antigen transport system permease protein